MKKQSKTIRKSISKKLRFEVFKRDKFCCGFCGKSAPDVILEIDHLKPVIKGGTNDILNLITACFDCNRGKGKRELSDDSTIKKQHKQLEKLQEKRSQIEMMIKWKNDLTKIDKSYIKYIRICLKDASGLNYELTKYGENIFLKLKKEFTDDQIHEAIKISFNQYYKFPENKIEQENQWNKAFNYIAKILKVQKSQENQPYLKDLFYCRVILRNKSTSMNDWVALDHLKSLIACGWDIEEIKRLCKIAYNWNDFYNYTTGKNE